MAITNWNLSRVSILTRSLLQRMNAPCPVPWPSTSRSDMKNIALRLLSIGVIALALAAPAHASYESGMAALNAGDYGVAMTEFRASAAQGDPMSQRALGIMYFKGQGVNVDPVEAAQWFSLAAGRGDAPAQSKRCGASQLGIPCEHWRQRTTSVLRGLAGAS